MTRAVTITLPFSLLLLAFGFRDISSSSSGHFFSLHLFPLLDRQRSLFPLSSISRLLRMRGNPIGISFFIDTTLNVQSSQDESKSFDHLRYLSLFKCQIESLPFDLIPFRCGYLVCLFFPLIRDACLHAILLFVLPFHLSCRSRQE